MIMKLILCSDCKIEIKFSFSKTDEKMQVALHCDTHTLPFRLGEMKTHSRTLNYDFRTINVL